MPLVWELTFRVQAEVKVQIRGQKCKQASSLARMLFVPI
ncbi:hypothetical protein C8K18_11424 [Paraburkholderia sp. GV068]|jgi:hypothetical protein|nr:hypothetical protein BCh11DRAFT_07468 [Burkholderia sp. Ch1-1]PTQ96501.1 hypothetical protein C8K19_110252 [Paraburkholderia sp. GV072]PUB00763.1 hypothetical protein C8K18_11424 [Paraburkholderia sp. GV068]